MANGADGHTARVAAEPSTGAAKPSTGAATGPVPEPAEALAALVAKLRSELDGVRTAMRNRAVIEQAKGVLVERLGISPDEGFDHLVRLSQRANVKLIEVAAAIVGTTAPDPSGPTVTELIDDELRDHLRRSRERERVTDVARAKAGTRAATKAAPKPATPRAARRPARPPGTEALQAQHQLLSARIASASSYDEVAQAVAGATVGWPQPATVVVTLLEPDGAHLFVGAHGIRAEVRSQWRRLPPHVDMPVAVAVRDRAALLLPDEAAVRRHFPELLSTPFAPGAVFAAPLLSGDRILGSLGLSWSEPVDLTDEAGRYLSALAGPVARRVAELRQEEAGQRSPAPDHEPAEPEGWLPIAVEAVPDPVVLLAPVQSDDAIVDFRVVYANTAARELIGPGSGEATLLGRYPRLGSRVLLPELTRVLRDGLAGRFGPVRVSDRDNTVVTGRAARLWDRVLLVWRELGEAELIYPQLLDAERIARIGSFSWDLRDGVPQGSPQLYRLFFGDEAARPIQPDELVACVHEEDLLAVQDAVRRTLVNGKQLNFEFRGAGRLAGQRLRVTAEPGLDDRGTVIGLRGTVQDVTEERAIEARLRLAEEALAAQRRRLEAELQAAQALQRALLPTDPELGTTEGLSVRGRCRESERTGRVDGDWYDACALPGGATLLVVGDVAGSGLAALTAAARLRYAVRAYAALNMSPGQVLGAVNAMLCSLEPERTATLVVARYEPDRRLLRWAVAGQAPPARYPADGPAVLLEGPAGLPVGASPDTRYEDSAAVLSPDDRVLLYTDGLVGGYRGGDGLAVLIDPIRHGRLDDIEALIRHLVRSLDAGPDEDMCAMVVRVHR